MNFQIQYHLNLIKDVKNKRDIIKIIIVKKYLFISLKSKFIFVNNKFIHKNIFRSTK